MFFLVIIVSRFFFLPQESFLSLKLEKDYCLGGATENVKNPFQKLFEYFEKFTLKGNQRKPRDGLQ